MASLTSRGQRYAARVLRAASVVVAPDSNPTTLVQELQSLLDTVLDLAVPPRYTREKVTARMTHPFNTRTRGGLSIDKIRFTLTGQRNTKRYRIDVRLVDGPVRRAAISEEHSTMLAAWNDFQRFLEAGECNTCGIILYAEDGGFRCQECDIRSSESIAVECCICLEERWNMYNLCCAHQICYGCAKSVHVKKCPQCRAYFTLCRGLREKVEDRMEDDNFELGYSIVVSSH